MSLILQSPRAVAVIDEAQCIGCTLCVKACPVDAIAGANGLMHTVIAAQCTGCGLCLPPCPVDCIALHPLPPWLAAWTVDEAGEAQRRHDARAARLEREAAETRSRRWAGRCDPARKRALIAAAIERAKAKRAARKAR